MNPALATLLLFLMAALGTGAGSVLQPSGVTSAQQPENDVVPNPRYGPPYLLVRFYDGGKPIRAQPFVKPLLVEPLGYNAQDPFAPFLRGNFSYGELNAYLITNGKDYNPLGQTNFHFSFTHQGNLMNLLIEKIGFTAGSNLSLDSIPFRPGNYLITLKTPSEHQRVRYRLPGTKRLTTFSQYYHYNQYYKRYYEANKQQLNSHNPFRVLRYSVPGIPPNAATYRSAEDYIKEVLSLRFRIREIATMKPI